MNLAWFSNLTGGNRYVLGALIGLLAMVLAYALHVLDGDLTSPAQYSRLMTMAALVAYITALTFSATFQRHLLGGYFLINLVLILHTMNVVWWGRLGLEVAASMFALIAIFCAIAINKQHLQLVLASWLLLLPGLLLAVPDPHISPAYLIVLLIPYGAVLYFFMGSLQELRERLAKQESWLNRSQIVAGIGGWEIDIALGQINYSSAAQDILGWDELPLNIAGLARFFFNKEDFRAFEQTLLACASGGDDIDVVTLTRPSEGAEMWVHVRGERVQTDAAAAKLVGVFTDVTESRQREEELIRAKDEALLAVSVRARFLANMSHEIRTPMNGVIGMASLLGDCDLGARERSYVNIIRSSGDSLLTIINSILDFSKIESGSIELEREHFSLEQIISESLDVVTAQAEFKGIWLYLNILELPCEDYIGDSSRLRQVLVNLLSNAVKFTEAGSITLTVGGVREPVDCDESVSSDDAESGLVALTFAVTDTGVGIAEDAIEGLFDPFSQADVSTTRQFGGTGLGLSISQEIAIAMGGCISVESSPGEGSTFTLELSLRADGDRQRSRLPPELGRVVLLTRNTTRAGYVSKTMALLGGELQVLTKIEELSSASDASVIIVDTESYTRSAVESLNQTVKNSRVVLSGGMSRRAQLSLPNQWLRIPVRSGELYAVLTESDTLSAAKTPQVKSNEAFEEMHVLLAEDNIVNQKVALQMLGQLGISADVANNGREALQMLGQRPYNIVIMDVQMPEMDGLQATATIRASSDLPQPWIIAMTANAMTDDKEACLAAGMNDFVAKPVRSNDMRQAMLRASVGAGIASNDSSKVSQVPG